jgi:hypothetical protein
MAIANGSDSGVRITGGGCIWLPLDSPEKQSEGMLIWMTKSQSIKKCGLIPSSPTDT